MVMKRVALWLPIVLLIAGCDGPTRLEKAAAQLKPGMHKAEVDSILGNAGTSIRQNLSRGIVVWTIRFQTNVNFGSEFDYSPTNSKLFTGFEDCLAYFDESDVIIGFRYSRDGIPPGAKPREK
jgi:hypothetical protein